MRSHSCWVILHCLSLNISSAMERPVPILCKSVQVYFCTSIAYHLSCVMLSVFVLFSYWCSPKSEVILFFEQVWVLGLFLCISCNVVCSSVVSVWMWPMRKSSLPGSLGLLSISSIPSGRTFIRKSTDGCPAYGNCMRITKCSLMFIKKRKKKWSYHKAFDVISKIY